MLRPIAVRDLVMQGCGHAGYDGLGYFISYAQTQDRIGSDQIVDSATET